MTDWRSMLKSAESLPATSPKPHVIHIGLAMADEIDRLLAVLIDEGCACDRIGSRCHGDHMDKSRCLPWRLTKALKD